MTSSGSVVDRGLDGIIAGATAVSHVDGERGVLRYRGYDATILATRASFEEVCHLLLYGRLPDALELRTLGDRLTEARVLPQRDLAWLGTMPHDAHPMDVLRTVVSGFAVSARREDGRVEHDLDVACELIARTPAVFAAWSRVRRGLTVLEPLPELSIAANLLYMRTGSVPTLAAQQALEAYFILLADSSFAASTFAARVTVSTRAGLYAGATTALATLGGESHGGALEGVMNTIDAVGHPERADAYVRAAFARGERVMGMGHRIYRVRDPRATELDAIAKSLNERAGTIWYAIACAIEDSAARAYRERRGKDIYANVELYGAPVLRALGFLADEMPCVYACAHMAGWTAHMLEQRKTNRLIRPQARYCGPAEATWLPLAERARAGASAPVGAGA